MDAPFTPGFNITKVIKGDSCFEFKFNQSVCLVSSVSVCLYVFVRLYGSGSLPVCKVFLFSLAKTLGPKFTRISPLPFFFLPGLFSFWQQPWTHGCDTIVDFIEKCMAHSRNGTFMYFLRPAGMANMAPMPLLLLHPVSRLFKVPSLHHLARFAILKTVRRDNVEELPLPPRLINYLLEPQYLFEDLGSVGEEEEESDDDMVAIAAAPSAATSGGSRVGAGLEPLVDDSIRGLRLGEEDQ